MSEQERIDAVIAKYRLWVEESIRIGRWFREHGYPLKGTQYRAGYNPMRPK